MIKAKDFVIKAKATVLCPWGQGQVFEDTLLILYLIIIIIVCEIYTASITWLVLWLGSNALYSINKVTSVTSWMGDCLW